MHKRLIIPGLATIILVSLLYFSSSPRRKKYTGKEKIKIGLSISYFHNDTYLDLFRKEFIEYSKNFPDVEIKCLNAEDNIEKQSLDIKYMVNGGAQSIVIIPVNPEAIYHIYSTAEKKDVNLIYALNKPSQIDKNAYYVGSDDSDAGLLQMTYLAELLDGEGNIAVLTGDLSMENSIKRTDALNKILENYPNIKIIKKQTANWNKEMSKIIVENWIKDGVKFNAVAANNDHMALGAIEALKKFKLLDEVIVCGIDAIPEALKALERGELEFTILQDYKEQARISFEKAYSLANLKLKHVKKIDLIPMKMLNRKIYKNKNNLGGLTL